MNLEMAKTTLLEHARSKKNGLFPEKTNFEGKLTNPLCGDHVHLKGHIENNVITHLGFSAQACAICTASASLLCKEVQGLKVQDALNLGNIFEENIIAPAGSEWPVTIQGLVSFEHLRENPSRRACALLAHIVLRSLLKE